MANVYFDITIDNLAAGRIVFKLYDNVVPKTSKNFRELATGQHGFGYNSSIFHRVVPRSRMQGGDFTNGNGTGGRSIYGEKFADEDFCIKHTKAGLLSMASAGPNTNNSQFFITTVPSPRLDGKHVVFGEVVAGYGVLREIEAVGSSSGKTSKVVKIAGCGTVPPAPYKVYGWLDVQGNSNEDPNLRLKTLQDLCCTVEDALNNRDQLENILKTEGEDAQLWLDALQALGKLPDIAPSLRSSMLKLMLRLSKNSALFPRCFMIENVEKLGDYPAASGGYGDVWKGRVGGQTVCLKVVKLRQDSDVPEVLKKYMREAIVWQQLDHPNTLPFMGAYYLDDAHQRLCLISTWMDRGDLSKFLEVTPSKDVDHYSLVYDVASGVSYLHNKDIVHGDLKSLNILIRADGRACIGDFGISRVRGAHISGLTSTKEAGGTMRYWAPELFNNTDEHSNTTATDIYAFACVCYEIFEAKAPFHEIRRDPNVIFAVMANQRPSRPKSSLLMDEMWGLVEECWDHEPSRRPAAPEVFNRVAAFNNPKTGNKVKPAPGWDTDDITRKIWENVKQPDLDVSAFTRLQRNLKDSAIRGLFKDICHMVEETLGNKDRLKNILESPKKDAQLWLDVLQVVEKLPDIAPRLQSFMLAIMLRLSEKSGLFPQCFVIENVEELGEHPDTTEMLWDVQKGRIEEQTVYLKVITNPFSDIPGNLKRSIQEAILWQQLDHPNISTFMGVCYRGSFQRQLCLISRWMDHGNLQDFLRVTPPSDTDHYSLVYDIACGISYLHSKDIIHGDLKPLDILIRADGRACITGFTLSQLCSAHIPHLSFKKAIDNQVTFRYSAPELLEDVHITPRTMATDIYAFACVCYFIFEANNPFRGIKDDQYVKVPVCKGQRPSRPKSAALTDKMWGLVEECWDHEPSRRPAAPKVFNRVAAFNNPKTGNKVKPAPGWDTDDFARKIWENRKQPNLNISALRRLQRKFTSSTPAKDVGSPVPSPEPAGAPSEPAELRSAPRSKTPKSARPVTSESAHSEPAELRSDVEVRVRPKKLTWRFGSRLFTRSSFRRSPNA